MKSLDRKSAMGLVLPGYHICQQIYESANSLVYRAIREQDKQPVILKALKPEHPQPEELTRYKQEYEITRRLDAAGVIARITEATEMMQRLLNDLLELWRIGRLINPPEAAPFEAIVREALKRVEGRLTTRKLQVEIAPGLPTISGDRPRLVEVVQNLVDNAIKFMGDQPEPQIEIGVKQQGNETRFYVADNGIGIAPQYHEKIFGLFERLDPTIEGTGVGLALVKRIIEVHGGRIWVESDGQGRGSTFYFTLKIEPQKICQSQVTSNITNGQSGF